MSRVLYRLGHACARARWFVVAGWIVLAVGLAVTAGIVGERTTENLTLPGSDSQRAADILDRDFPAAAATTAPMLVKAGGGELTGPDNSKAVADTVTKLKAVEHVTDVVSPLSQAGAANLSQDEKIGQIQVTFDIGADAITDDTADQIDVALDPARDAGLDAAAGGHRCRLRGRRARPGARRAVMMVPRGAAGSIGARRRRASGASVGEHAGHRFGHLALRRRGLRRRDEQRGDVGTTPRRRAELPPPWMQRIGAPLPCCSW